MPLHPRGTDPFGANFTQTFRLAFALNFDVKMGKNVLQQWLLHVKSTSAVVAFEELLAMQQHVMIELLFCLELFVTLAADF